MVNVIEFETVQKVRTVARAEPVMVDGRPVRVNGRIKYQNVTVEEPYTVQVKRVRPETAEEEAARRAMPAPTGADVNAYRDGLILAGKSFTLDGYANEVRLEGDPITMRNLDTLALAANVRLAQGDTTHVTKYRDAENVIHDLTPPQILSLWQQGAGFVEAVMQVSWAIKDDPDGIADDFRADPRWP